MAELRSEDVRFAELDPGRGPEGAESPDPRFDAIADTLKDKGPVVPLRGYLTSAEQASGDKTVRRLYTSPCFDQWLEICDEDILYQQRGFGLLDLNSIIWVKQTATIKRFTCASGEAREFIERPNDDLDPTTGGPRYGHRRGGG